ncbi:hypothetical protein T484DRAFT_1612133, partial [Baffinella frigidus]
MVHGSGFRVQGSGFWVQGSGCRGSYPMQRDSWMFAIFEVGVTSTHSLPAEGKTGRRRRRSPMRTTGQYFMHSCPHFFGLHL